MNQVAEIFSVEQPLAVYNEFRAQLAEWKALNEKTVFDYEDPKGNKEARSHIYKMRQSKGAVEKARKEAKQAALDYGRLVDSEAKEIVAEIDSMIDVHQKPLDEIEQREKDRIEAIQVRIDRIKQLEITEGLHAAAIQAQLTRLESIAIDDSWQEFLEIAAKAKDSALSLLREKLSAQQKYEAEQEELARLRREAAEREQKERDERIAREAAERAQREAEQRAEAERQAAEAKAKAEREAGERRELELKLAAERAEREKLEAEERAKQAAVDAERREKEAVKAAEEKAKREAEEAARREKEEAERREANKRHAAKINREAAAALAEAGLTSEQAKAVIVLIAQRKVPHVTISY